MSNINLKNLNQQQGPGRRNYVTTQVGMSFSSLRSGIAATLQTAEMGDYEATRAGIEGMMRIRYALGEFANRYAALREKRPEVATAMATREIMLPDEEIIEFIESLIERGGAETTLRRIQEMTKGF